MSLIPAFEIGLWNAWIPAIYWLVIPVILAPLVSKEALKKVLTSFTVNKTEKMIMNILHPMTYALIIYSVFVPLKLGTMWFYVGLFLFVVGATIYTIATVNFITTPLDKLVTKGVYRVSRHPIHFSYFVMYLGIGIACASWILLLCSVVYMILQDILHSAEERFCLDRYGDAYREYMNKTPRYFYSLNREVNS